MSLFQLAIGAAGIVLKCALLVALVARGHHRREPLFVVYVATVTLSNLAVGIWHRWDVWLMHQSVAAAVRFGVALGLAYAVFRHFPGAAATARRVIVVVLGVTLAAVLAVPDETASYTAIAGLLVPRIANGTVWLFTALAALVLWYRIPLSALQKAILLGFAPYLLVFTLTMNMLATIGWHVRDHVGYANTVSYLALIAYWTVVAWRPVRGERVIPAAIRRPATARVDLGPA